MERSPQQELLHLQAVVDQLRGEVRTLRAALDEIEDGRVLLRQGEEFSRLLSVSQLIVSELDLAKVYDLVASRAREMVDAETVLVPMLSERRDRYTYVAAAGEDADAVRGSGFAAHVGMCGWVLQNGRSLLFGETSTQWMEEKTPWETGQQSAALVPLVGRAGIIGGLSALGKRGGGCFTQHDLDLLTMFANQVSIAIENARLFQEAIREEEKLRESEKFVRTILNTVDEGIIVVDREFRVRVANRAYADQVPNAGEGAVGQYCYMVTHGSHRPCFEAGEECAVRRVFEDGSPHRALHKHAAQDGRLLLVETRAFPLRDASGHVTSAIEVFADITERHLLEQERLRTQKLEAVGTLAGGIAHDFNNLLQGVFGYVSLAKLQLEDRDKTLATLEEAEKSLRLSVQLTNQLLTFSKGGRPTRKAFDLLPVVENAARLTLSGSRAQWRVSAEDGLWSVDGDEGQLYQVIQNLALNADQAMPTGGALEIRLRNVRAPAPGTPQELKEGPYVQVSVQDGGIGIPEKYLSKIFDPYFTTKEKGSGLGLATSYSIVRNHDGAIEVASTPGEGTTFTLYLPATSAPTATARERSAPATPRRAGRVLVMDDEPVIRRVAASILKRIGHRVETAANGEEALALYRAAMQAGDRFDLVILDLTIRGGMGGSEAVGRLLELDPDVVAVVSSGYSEDAGTASYREQGFKAYLKKPYDLDDLRGVVNGLLAE